MKQKQLSIIAAILLAAFDENFASLSVYLLVFKSKGKL